MTFPSSGLNALAQGILNTTAALTTANVATPTTTPTANKYGAVGVNANASTSLTASGYGLSQGICANPSGRMDVVIPQQLVNLYNTILTQTNLVYRM